MDCASLQNNLERCNCTYEPCSRKGNCCECIAYHKRLGELPACYFTDQQERTYNRSISYFVKCNSR